MSGQNTRRVIISDGGALRAILEVEGDTRVVAVLLPNGSVVPSKDIPRWVWQAIRNRGLVYDGDAPAHDVPSQLHGVVTRSAGWRGMCKWTCIVFGGLVMLIFVIGFIAAIIDSGSSGDGGPVSSVVPSPTPTPFPTPTPPVYVSPEDILRTFRANPARGKVQFMEEPIYVSGTVRGFNHSDSRVVYLTREGGQEDYMVFLVRFATLEEVAVLSIGDDISIRCDLSTGVPFLGGREIECAPVGPVSVRAAASSPESTSPSGSVDAQAEAAPQSAILDSATPTPTSLPRYCQGMSGAQLEACLQFVEDPACRDFYDDPVGNYELAGRCTPRSF